MPKRTVKAISDAFKGLSPIAKLKAEIELLTKGSEETVYRLRYDTMRYDYISPSVAQLLGYTAEEFLSLNMRSLIVETRMVGDGLRAVQSYSVLEESRKRGEVKKWQADYLMKTKDGRQIWISDISHPWFDSRGAIIGSIGSLRDISERIAAEHKIREELLRLTGADTLTGLSNRQTFWAKLEDETRRIRRSHGDLGLLLIEIDQFHKVSDAYGQEMSDAVLAGIARLIQGTLREIDLASRLNGEEFGVVLPETTTEGAAKVAERIRDAIARHTFFAGSHNKPVGCTVSIGVAGTRFGQKTDAAHLYKLADMRLYIAKHAGESQISAEEVAGNVH
jgi:diguanylate cyclase (GGDEF)-like protein/PAS domain S-box-containing protein